MTRLFVAAWPPPATAQQLADLLDAPADGVRPVPRHQLHVTLRFIGDADPEHVADRLDQADLTSGNVRLGPRVVRLGDRQLVVPVAGAEQLAGAVAVATRGLGRPGRRDFFGHVTIARMRRGAHSAVEGRPIDGTFPLDDVRLVASALEPRGAVYTTIRSYAPA